MCKDTLIQFTCYILTNWKTGHNRVEVKPIFSIRSKSIHVITSFSLNNCNILELTNLPGFVTTFGETQKLHDNNIILLIQITIIAMFFKHCNEKDDSIFMI